MKSRHALATRLILVPALACLAAGCDLGKPEPPYKDPPRDQRIKSQEPRQQQRTPRAVVVWWTHPRPANVA